MILGSSFGYNSYGSPYRSSLYGGYGTYGSYGSSYNSYGYGFNNSYPCFGMDDTERRYIYFFQLKMFLLTFFFIPQVYSVRRRKFKEYICQCRKYSQSI